MEHVYRQNEILLHMVTSYGRVEVMNSCSTLLLSG